MMATGRITRRELITTVHVDGSPRRFRLRASSVARHLQLIELQQDASTKAPDQVSSISEVLECWALSQKETICLLLSEPVDGGGPLTEEDFWQLDPEELPRLQRLQEKLTNASGALGSMTRGITSPTLGEIADNWLEISGTIARARLVPDLNQPLNEWSLEQCVQAYHLACRELWRETAFQVRLAGGDPGQEPKFWPPTDPQLSTEKKAKNDQEFEAMKKAYREKNSDPEGRKFPGTL